MRRWPFFTLILIFFLPFSLQTLPFLSMLFLARILTDLVRLLRQMTLKLAPVDAEITVLSKTEFTKTSRERVFFDLYQYQVKFRWTQNGDPCTGLAIYFSPNEILLKSDVLPSRIYIDAKSGDTFSPPTAEEALSRGSATTRLQLSHPWIYYYTKGEGSFRLKVLGVFLPGLRYS